MAIAVAVVVARAVAMDAVEVAVAVVAVAVVVVVVGGGGGGWQWLELVGQAVAAPVASGPGFGCLSWGRAQPEVGEDVVPIRPLSIT